MTAAHPISVPEADDLDLTIGSPGDFSTFSPEGQAIIRAAEAREALGMPSATVPGTEILAHVEHQRAEASKSGE